MAHICALFVERISRHRDAATMPLSSPPFHPLARLPRARQRGEEAVERTSDVEGEASRVAFVIHMQTEQASDLAVQVAKANTFNCFPMAGL